jgi:hypothetical protein
MTSLPLHSITEDYADLTDAEAAAMRASLEAVGVINPIVLWWNEVVDGRHRAKFCQELGIEPRYVDISDQCPTEEAMRKHVAALNEHRRARTTPLSNEEKRARIAAELRGDPTRSDRAVAETVGVHHETVGAVRAKLEQTGDVAKTATRTDTKGRNQPAKKSKWKQPTKKPKPAPAASNSTPAAGSISTQSTSPKNSVPALNPLSWLGASPEERQWFIRNVDPRMLWDAMTEQQRDVCIEYHKKLYNEMEEANAALQTFSAVVQIEDLPPGVMPDIPKFLDRRETAGRPGTSGQSAYAPADDNIDFLTGAMNMKINTRVFENRLRCECGRPVKSSDFREEVNGVLCICAECHKDLAALDIVGGDDDEG